MKPQDKARQLRPYIEEAAASLPDEDALEAVELFPAWAADTAYPVGIRVRYNDTLYRCEQAHTSQAGWEPPHHSGAVDGGCRAGDDPRLEAAYRGAGRLCTK